MRNYPTKPMASRGDSTGHSAYAALAQHYDMFSKNMDYKKRTEYLCTLLSRAGAKAGDTLLDLACGTGTYTCALLQCGYDVIGIDASADMLGVAREKAVELQLPPPLLLCQKLEALDLYGTAQAAVCLTDSLNHLTGEARVQQFFKRLALFLEPNAPFIFDVNTLYKQEQILADNAFVYEEEGVLCVWQNRWKPSQRSTEITLDIFAQEHNGTYTRAQDCFTEQVYSIEEITEWLNRAGFSVEHIYEELTQQSPSPTAQRLFFVARRLHT